MDNNVDKLLESINEKLVKMGMNEIDEKELEQKREQRLKDCEEEKQIFRDKIHKELIDERNKRVAENHGVMAMKGVSDFVNNHKHKYFINKMDELKIYDNIIVELDKKELVDNIDSEDKKINFSITIDGKLYKGNFNSSKKGISEKRETFVDESCPYHVDVRCPSTNYIDVSSDDYYVTFRVFERNKHNKFIETIKNGDFSEYEKLARLLIREAKCYADEERLVLITANICKKNEINPEPFENILDSLYETSKYGKEVIENHKIPDDNIGNEDLDRKKREINLLKDEILSKIEKLEEAEFSYQRDLDRFNYSNNK